MPLVGVATKLCHGLQSVPSFTRTHSWSASVPNWKEALARLAALTSIAWLAPCTTPLTHEITAGGITIGIPELDLLHAVAVGIRGAEQRGGGKPLPGRAGLVRDADDGRSWFGALTWKCTQGLKT